MRKAKKLEVVECGNVIEVRAVDACGKIIHVDHFANREVAELWVKWMLDGAMRNRTPLFFY